MSYENFDEFMASNKKLLHSDELRPTKSITRNIITAVQPFVNYYKETKLISLNAEDISKKILHLDTNMSSTTRDNIRNLEELRFIAKSSEIQQYRFTRNFADFVNSGLEVKEYILKEINSIKYIEDITMFYNCILCLLYEASKYGCIINYPDSYSKFKEKVKNKETRTKLCEKVYEIYGFSGKGDEMGNYTPNANYRFLSTCVSLGIIERQGTDSFGFGKYILTKQGEMLLTRIDNNMSWIKTENVNTEINDDQKEKISDIRLYDDNNDEEYNSATENIPLEMLEEIVDMPIPLANTFGNPINKRDVRKGANAKKRANYLCEYDNGHMTFSTSNFSRYVEAHHLIPLSVQNRFMLSLDVEANIVVLCSNCHNLLHYGESCDKKPILKKLYANRIERLKNCGIFITEEELLKIYE